MTTMVVMMTERTGLKLDETAPALTISLVLSLSGIVLSGIVGLVS